MFLQPFPSVRHIISPSPPNPLSILPIHFFSSLFSFLCSILSPSLTMPSFILFLHLFLSFTPFTMLSLPLFSCLFCFVFIPPLHVIIFSSFILPLHPVPSFTFFPFIILSIYLSLISSFSIQLARGVFIPLLYFLIFSSLSNLFIHCSLSHPLRSLCFLSLTHFAFIHILHPFLSFPLHPCSIILFPKLPLPPPSPPKHLYLPMYFFCMCVFVFPLIFTWPEFQSFSVLFFYAFISLCLQPSISV